MQTKLSRTQKWILADLLESHEQGYCPHWGTVWHPKKWMPDMSASDSVNLSRAVARLETRGLLIRQNKRSGTSDSDEARTTPDSTPPKRCTHILLTPNGFEVARTLQSDAKELPT